MGGLAACTVLLWVLLISIESMYYVFNSLPTNDAYMRHELP